MRNDILKVIKEQNGGALENYGFEKKNCDRNTQNFLGKKNILRHFQEETTFLIFLL